MVDAGKRKQSRGSPTSSIPPYNLAIAELPPCIGLHTAQSQGSNSLVEDGNEQPIGLKILAPGNSPIIECAIGRSLRLRQLIQDSIVAIHGLNGHRDKTWTADNEKNWLKDFLPTDFENARILSWGYDANTHNSSGVSTQSIYAHGLGLISDLCLFREKTSTVNRPILFVVHSLGGLVLKSGLIHSNAARNGANEKHRSIMLSTYGIIFMGTPHQGGQGTTLGVNVSRIANIFVPTTDHLIKNLEEHSEWLEQNLGQYAPISGLFETKFAYEVYDTPIVGRASIRVVPQWSACVPGVADAEQIAINGNHLTMVKFDSKQVKGYTDISGHLVIMAKKAEDEIKKRWAKEHKNNADDEETYSVPFSLVSASETETFVGRREELAELRDTLHGGDASRIVLVHGLGGVGKTQLAIAYAKEQFRHDQYSAFFWMNAKDEHTLKQSYMTAARRVLSAHPSASYLSDISKDQLNGEPDVVVNAMKQWFDITQNKRWLIVYDNYDDPIGQGTDITAGLDISHFIPNAYHGSIIITPTSSRVDQTRRCILVGKLEDSHASLQILLNTSRRHHAINDPGAMALTKELDGHPLALVSAGAYLDNVETTFYEYLKLYRATYRTLQDHTPKIPSYENAKLYTTWQLSLERIKQKNEAAAKLLQFWAYLDKQDIWYELLHGRSAHGPGWFSQVAKDLPSFDGAIRLLREYGLVELTPFALSASETASEVQDDGLSSEEQDSNSSSEEPTYMEQLISESEPKGYSIHSCVHAWLKHVLCQKTDLEMAELALSCVCLHADSIPEWYLFLTALTRLVGHATRCVEYIEDIPKYSEDLEILQSLGNILLHGKMLPEAERILLRALGQFDQPLKATREMQNLVTMLVRVYRAQRIKQKESKRIDAALESFMNEYGVQDPRVLMLWWFLSPSEYKSSEYESEEGLLRSLLASIEDVMGLEGFRAKVVICLGNIIIEKGMTEEAEGHWKTALDLFDNFPMSESVDVRTIMQDLADLCFRQRRNEEAKAYLRQTVTAFKKLVRTDERDWELKAVQYRLVGNIKMAKFCFEKLLASLDKEEWTDRQTVVRMQRRLKFLENSQLA